MAFWPVVASSTSSTSCGAPSICLADDAVDLLQLAHQVGLRVQPAGGVHDQHVELPGLGLLAGVVGHAGRVAALLVLDDLAAEPLAPDGQLLDGGRPEGVAGRHHHLLAFFLAAPGQLGDGRRLARAVDAGHHDHRRPGRVVVQPALGASSSVLELLLDERLHVAGDFLVQERLADALDDLGGGGGADVGQVEPFLQLVEEVAIDPAAQAEQRGDARRRRCGSWPGPV